MPGELHLLLQPGRHQCVPTGLQRHCLELTAWQFLWCSFFVYRLYIYMYMCIYTHAKLQKQHCISMCALANTHADSSASSLSGFLR